MSERMINVASEFSKFPAGRFRTDGKNSGERFREDFLVPALTAPEVTRVTINFDGVLMGGSSFLEEAFGGLIRKEGISASQLSQKIVVTCKSETVKKQIETYIKKA